MYSMYAHQLENRIDKQGWSFMVIQHREIVEHLDTTYEEVIVAKIIGIDDDIIMGRLSVINRILVQVTVNNYIILFYHGTFSVIRRAPRYNIMYTSVGVNYNSWVINDIIVM